MRFITLLLGVTVLMSTAGCVKVDKIGTPDAKFIQGPPQVIQLDDKYNTVSPVIKVKNIEAGMVVVANEGGAKWNAYIVPYQEIPVGTLVRLIKVERKLNRNVSVTDLFVERS